MTDNKKSVDRSGDDPSFIRPNAADLVNWARRLGLSQQELREAMDGGLIKPAAGVPAHVLEPHAGERHPEGERPGS